MGKKSIFHILLRTLARDRRTLRVCACGWGCPGRLQDFVQGLCKIFSGNFPCEISEIRAQIHPKMAPKLYQNRPKWLQNGSRDPSGEVSGKSGKKNSKKGATLLDKRVPFRTPKSTKKSKNAKRGHSRILPTRAPRGVVHKFGLFPRRGPSAGHFARPGGPRGAVRAPPGA